MTPAIGRRVVGTLFAGPSIFRAVLIVVLMVARSGPIIGPAMGRHLAGRGRTDDPGQGAQQPEPNHQ